VLPQLTEGNASALERSAAQYIQEKLRGFGPKQSRNLLQTLGLTKFEIPLDSRVLKWLNTVGFPVPLSASALSDESYYSFVMDGVQELCAACGVFPCILDAAVFSSFDRAGGERRTSSSDWPLVTRARDRPTPSFGTGCSTSQNRTENVIDLIPGH